MKSAKNLDLENICRLTIDAVKEVGDYILDVHENRSDIQLEEKGLHDFVTSVDKTAEEKLVKSLSSIVPAAGFVAEEGSGGEKADAYNWIIDPLDGTTNFIHGAYPFAISVALAYKERPILGVVLELGFKECFYAWQSGGAYLNGKAIRVSEATKLQHSLIATGFPYREYDRMTKYMGTIDWFMKNSRGLRRLGSAATDIAWVACGRYDGFYEYGLHAWDIAAGAIILHEAGGRCTDFNGSSDFLFGNDIICSNGKTHDEFLEVIDTLMN